MQSTGAPNSVASLAIGFPSRFARRRPVVAVVSLQPIVYVERSRECTMQV